MNPSQNTTTPRDEPTTVFISYAFEEAEFANRLKKHLSQAGINCWLDTDNIRAGDKWVAALSEAILNSYAVVIVATRKSLQSDWVQREIDWAIINKITIIPFLREQVMTDKGYFPLAGCQWVSSLNDEEFEAALPKLTRSLEALKPKKQPVANTGRRLRSIPRELERAYFQRLQTAGVNEIYTPLGGTSEQQARHAAMRPSFGLMRVDDDGRLMSETLPFDDAVKVIKNIRQAVLLGEPGGGKTTTIWKLAADLVETALVDECAPIPLLISLREWDKADQSLMEFIATQLGDLGAYLGQMLSNESAALLLDGLNEMRVGLRETKYPEVERFIKQHPKLMAVVSCRKDDYTIKLGFDCINITPLDPLRIREFVGRYLGQERGEPLFWKLAGERTRDYHASFIQTVGAEHEKVFWLADKLPTELEWTFDWDKKNEYGHWDGWFRHRENPSGLLALAGNPFMLTMLASVYDKRGDLPPNRGKLFNSFVENLLDRERKDKEILPAEQAALIEGLASIAFEMQNIPANQPAGQKSDAAVGASTVMPQNRVLEILGERLFYLAVSASILSKDDQVRFTHQLLQEYFAAKQMDILLQAGKLKAETIWKPENWWERNNWEEAAVLLAGLYSDDCSRVVEWVAEANPEVAAQCVTRSGAELAEATKERLRAEWIPRLTDLKRDPNPLARAAIGRALGLTGWDNRKGVGVVEKNGVTLPDIEWIRIPEGEFQYGVAKAKYAAKPQKLWLPEFHISRYPITYSQFQTFLDDPDGFNNPRWFEGLAANEGERLMREQAFKFDNHPRETVNWYQAMAFCRWLTWRLDRVGSPRVSKGLVADDKALAYARATDTGIRLPTEFEWEKAARGTDGRLYPYKGKYDPKKGNVRDARIRQTSAVGIFPNGKSPYGVEEMSGNVLEWCLSDYNDPRLDAGEENLRTEDRRVLRGGSWFGSQMVARAVCRVSLGPGGRDSNIGFRVVVFRPPSS